jgi:gluconolactonase
MSRFLPWGVIAAFVCLAFSFCSQPSNPPTNQLSSAAPTAPVAGTGSVIEKDTALKDIVPADAKIEKLAGGFAFTEGPIWMKDGFVLFSDIPNNSIMKWTPDGKVSTFRKPSGYTGPPAPAGAYIGSNGLTLDKEGRLVICEHGDHRVTRLEKDGTVTVLATATKANGSIAQRCGLQIRWKSLFHRSSYGVFNEKARVGLQEFYRLSPDGKLQLLDKELTRPNGLAFSPDEKILYVSNSDPDKKVWMAYDVAPDGTLGHGRLF